MTTPKRIASVALFHLRIGVARTRMASQATSSEAHLPLAVVVGTQSERALQGGTRIDEVSQEAFALGVRPGMTLAAARARSASLLVRVVPPDAIEASIALLAETLLAFGATVSYVITGASNRTRPIVNDDAVFVDVTGCAHLHACAEDPTGERRLAAKLGAHVEALGFVGRVAIANGPKIAHAMARHSPVRGQPAFADDGRGKRNAKARAPHRAALLPIVVAPGTEREAMGALPMAALSQDDDTERYLRKLGLFAVADLLALPQDALGSRLGLGASDALLLSRGIDRTPLAPYLPPEVPEERASLDDPLEHTEALLFVAKGLTDRMGARLLARGLRANHVELEFLLERSLVPEAERDKPAASPSLSLKLAAPIGAPAELFAIVRARLESFEVIAPVRAIILRCRDLAPARGKALALFEAEPKAERALPELAAELTTLLGRENVGVLAPVDTWALEKRTNLVPFADRAKTRPSSASQGRPWGGEEPLRFVRMPVPRPFPRVAPLVQRQEGLEWWRRPSASLPSANLQGERKTRDFVIAWDEERQAAAWLELDRAEGRAWLRGWKE